MTKAISFVSRSLLDLLSDQHPNKILIFFYVGVYFAITDNIIDTLMKTVTRNFNITYNKGPEELYRLFKMYEKEIESLNGKFQVISNRVSTLEFQSKKTLQIAISCL